MTTVLIPTDFNVESLRIIDTLVLNPGSGPLRIIFLHAFKLSDSISDILMLSRRTRDYANISDEFYEQLDVYQQKYSAEVKGIGIEYFYGSTVAAFKNLLETLAVDYIAYGKNDAFRPINKYSIDPKHLTAHCGCTVIELDTAIVAQSENLFESKIPQEEPLRVISA